MVKCSVCNSVRVEEKRWVDPNTLKVSDIVDEGSDSNGYCLDCGEHNKLNYPDVEWEVEKSERRKLI